VDTPTPVLSDTPTVALPATAEGSAASQELAAQGLKVYQQLYCGICHRLDAAGTAGMFGPPHNGMAVTAEQRIRDPQYTGTAKTAAEYIRESIVSPATYIVEGYQQTRHHMPAYNQLSQTDLEALVQMLLQQK
jgi:mono/diheme cytochrome c family protein